VNWTELAQQRTQLTFTCAAMPLVKRSGTYNRKPLNISGGGNAAYMGIS